MEERVECVMMTYCMMEMRKGGEGSMGRREERVT